VGILQAAEKGLLDLNEPVKRYLPWFRVKTKAHQITAHHLLSHTASLPLGRDDLPPSRYAAAALAEFEPTFPPGKYYYDSNVDYHILQFLLEDVTGTPYGEVIRQNIFDPLDMCESYAAITHDIRAKIVMGYQRLHNDRPGHWTYPLTPAPWFEWTAADGSVAATAKDLAIFCRMLLNQGRLNNVHILSEASYKLMTARVAQRFKDSYFGLGTYVRLMDGNTIIGHGGNMPGHQSMMLGDTDTGIGAVVLINGPGSPWAIASYVLSQYRARHRGEPVSAVVPVEDEMMVENASDYVGTYTGHNRTVSVISEGKRLILIYDSHHVVLEPREDDDVFYANHKSLRLFLWQFEREDNKVVATNYGPHWYATAISG
jgi:CubicO group peptidase (beta-lactamase class C family)